MPISHYKSHLSTQLTTLIGVSVLMHIFCVSRLYSQVIHPSVNAINYSISDGLPSAETYDVFQDSKGYIWIGTDNGVVKYDGAKFNVYTTQDGLTDNTVFKISEDTKGRIWFATYNRRLCYYENEVFTNYRYNHVLEKELVDVNFGTTITRLIITPEDSLILEFVWRANSIIPNIGIDSLGNSVTYNSTQLYDGLIPISQEEDRLTLFKNLAQLFSDKPSGYSRLIQTVIFDRIRISKWNNLTAISTPNGIYFYSDVKEQVVRHILRGYYITSITTDFEGGIWCSSLYNGLFYIPNRHLQQFELDAIKSGHIHGIIETEEELIFSFNADQGDYVFNENKTQLKRINLPKSMYSLLESDLAEGITFENDIFFIESLSDINSIARLDDTSLVASSPSHGLVKLSSKDNIEKDKSKRVYTYHDFFGFEWFFYIKNSAREYAPNKYYIVEKLIENTPKILRLLRASPDQFYLGTLDGLFEYTISTGTLKKSNLLGENNRTRIQDIIRVSDSTILFATKGDGIIGVTNGRKFEIEIRRGTELNAIYQLILDPKTHIVYAATNLGVYQLTKTGKEWSYTSIISLYDGLKSTDVRQIKICKDTLYFANNTGVGRIGLAQIHPSVPPPLLNITVLSRGLKKYDFSTPILIPFDSNSFDIRYQAIGFKSRNNFIYSYRIRKNGIWKQTTNSAITFNSLDPGKYTLELFATNVQGLKSKIQQRSFTIETPYWMTWWFVTLLFLVIVTAIYFIVYRIITFYKKQAAFQRKISELQILSLQSKMSPHFIFNSLNAIQNYILTNNKIKANEYLIDFSRLIRTILQTSEKSTILLSKEVDILHMYVDLEKKRLRKDFQFSIEMEGEIDVINCRIPSLLIQPYIENSIWHGQVYNNPKGEIKINIKNVNHILEIVITDNGVGIEKASCFKKENPEMHKSMGTEVTKNRIQLLSELNHQMSDVIIDNAFPEDIKLGFVGTRICFTIPYQLQSTSL